jgi:hypothetical protein
MKNLIHPRHVQANAAGGILFSAINTTQDVSMPDVFTPEKWPSRLVAPEYAVIGTFDASKKSQLVNICYVVRRPTLYSRAMFTALTTSSVDLGRTTTE